MQSVLDNLDMGGTDEERAALHALLTQYVDVLGMMMMIWVLLKKK